MIIWKEKALKILYYDLNIINNNGANKNVNVLNLENIEDDNICIDTPIFLFSSIGKLFLISSFDEDTKLINLYEIKINDNNINLNNKIKKIKFEKFENENIIFAKLISNEKFLVVFSNVSLYLLKFDEHLNYFIEIKNRKHNIVGDFKVRQLSNEEFYFLMHDYKSNKCQFFNFQAWVK